MTTAVRDCLSYNADSVRSEHVMAPGRTEVRRPHVQIEWWQSDVDTIGAGDSLVIDELPEELLYQLPAAIGSFLRRCSRRGYCPPIPAIRRLGFQTKHEFEQKAAG
jgi:hypothetical protein